MSEKVLNKKCVVIFSIKFSNTFHFLRILGRDMIQNVYRCSLISYRYSCQILVKHAFS
jgi:hypothetical protein